MDKDIVACKNLSHHGDKWLFTTGNEKTETFPCFACCILSLEDKQELVLRKRIILSCFRNLMDSNAQVMIAVVSVDKQVVLHTLKVFLDLLKYNDEGLFKLSGECLLLFLIHMKEEGLGLAVMQRLTLEIEEDCNYALSLPQLRVLGQLFKMFPELLQQGDHTKSKFLHMLANGLSYPSDEVKDAILFLLCQIYRNLEKYKVTSRSFDSVFVRHFLRILKGSQNKHLVRSTLDLLKIFITNEIQSFSVLFESDQDEMTFADISKKIILSNEPSFKICMVQCLCKLLSNSLFEKHIPLLLEANIPEILFDALSTKNELLLESILCCLHLFVQKAEDSIKSHFIFGTGIIMDVCCSLMSVKNWRLLCSSMNLLTSIISSNQYLMISSHITFYYQTVQVTEKAFKIQNLSVLHATCKFFTEFLKNKDLPWALPLEQIHNNVNLCLKSQSKFISLTAFENVRRHPGPVQSLSLEMKLLICTLDMISACIRLCTRYNSNPVSVETGFACPKICSANQTTSSNSEKSAQPLILLCLSSLDEIFIPCCLQLKAMVFGKVAWYHLAQVLAVVYEDIDGDISIYNLAKKLIRAGIFKHVFDVKVCTESMLDCGSEEVKNICSQCVKGLLKCVLRTESNSDLFKKALDVGITELDGSLEECANVLSLKSNVETGSTELWASPPQIAFLSLCYISYLNEAFIVNIKVLIPHLICFVTCNSDLLSSCIILLKHLTFLMAVSTYECVDKNLKFQTGLMEANMILWDLLSKLKSHLEVYTHHKYMLWWCFKNQTCNPFSSSVLQTWLNFSVDEKQNLRRCAIKTVILLLCSCQNARQTFVLLFDVSSSSNNEVLIQFLKEAYELEDSREARKEKFQNLIILMIHHLHSFLVKLFILKNENDKDSSKIICQGLDCLLWCHKQIEETEINAKIIFHISKYCILANQEIMTTTITCINFLLFTLSHDKHFEKAWQIITGDLNFPYFLYKCFTSHSQLEVEALSLLVVLFSCQVKYNLKCDIHVQIPPKQLLTWLNSSNTQILAIQLLNLAIKSGFEDKVVFIPLENDPVSIKNEQYSFYRLSSLYLQNVILSDNPVFLEETIDNYLSLLTIISKTDKNLERHIMLQPWIKVLMESRLEKLGVTTWSLLEKWLSYDKVNPSIIGVVQQFAMKLQTKCNPSEIERRCMNRLITGVYSNSITKEIKDMLMKLSEERAPVNEENFVSQVQDIVSSYLYNVQ